MWSSHVLRFLYDSLNSWVISGFILFQVKEIMSALSTYMGTINPTKIIQALSSYFQCFSQLENLLWICFWVLLDGWLVLFYALECIILFGIQRASTRGSILVAYEIPPAFLTRIGGQMFADVGVVSEQSSHIGLFWNLNLGEVLYLWQSRFAARLKPRYPLVNLFYHMFSKMSLLVMDVPSALQNKWILFLLCGKNLGEQDSMIQISRFWRTGLKEKN